MIVRTVLMGTAVLILCVQLPSARAESEAKKLSLQDFRGIYAAMPGGRQHYFSQHLDPCANFLIINASARTLYLNKASLVGKIADSDFQIDSREIWELGVNERNYGAINHTDKVRKSLEVVVGSDRASRLVWNHSTYNRYCLSPDYNHKYRETIEEIFFNSDGHLVKNEYFSCVAATNSCTYVRLTSEPSKFVPTKKIPQEKVTYKMALPK